MNIKVIIAASGTGTRMGGDKPKQFQLLNKVPVLKHTISAFNSIEYVSEIAVAVPMGYIKSVNNYGFEKVRHIVEGGNSRAESIYKALQCLSSAENNQIILIHDGARPLISHETIILVAEATAKHHAAIACAPVTDTIKTVDTTGKITSTPNRNNLWRAQTPQGFTYEIISKAYEQGEKDGILSNATDDSALVERLNIPVYTVPSPNSNIKITTPEDMIIAQSLLKEVNI